MKQYFLFILAQSILSSCVSEVNLSPAKGETKVVIEGVLTDEEYDREFQEKYLREEQGNYVRLTYSDPVNSFAPYELSPDGNHYTRDRTTAIRNALVIIRDNLGEADTLIADSAQSEPFYGYYTSKDLVCKAGRTYSLYVKIAGKEFTAAAFMPPVPQLDSVSTVYIERGIDKFSGDVPSFYFQNNLSVKEYFLPKVTLSGATLMDWGNKTASFQWNRLISNRLFMTNNVSYSAYGYHYQILNDGRRFDWNANQKELNLKSEFDYSVSDGTVFTSAYQFICWITDRYLGTLQQRH